MNKEVIIHFNNHSNQHQFYHNTSKGVRLTYKHKRRRLGRTGLWQIQLFGLQLHQPVLVAATLVLQLLLRPKEVFDGELYQSHPMPDGERRVSNSVRERPLSRW